ncbi:MAG TPA: ABC transporter substrate-binding protein, partial [Candidatus Aquilonibacter sp.]
PNPYYFRGQPRLKEIDFMIIPNRDTIFAQLAAHELDMWAHVGGVYYARMNELTGFTALKRPTYQWGHIDFNLAHPALADPVVRKAIELATDRQTIITKIARGVGILREGVVPQSAPYYDPNIALVPFNIAQANKLLDADGWKRGPDGIREKNGVKLNLNFAAITGLVNVDNMIELLRSSWKQIGVGIDVHHYPTPLFFGTYQDGGILYTGKWDVTLFNWVNDPIGDFSALYACDEFPPSGQNVVRWCDPKANAAMHALFTHYDQAQRNADDRIVQEALAQDRPQFTLLGTEEIYIYNKDLKNFHPNDITPFDGALVWDI